jgi:hypothetical protein
LNSQLRNQSGHFPQGLISPPYHRGEGGRSWSLISVRLKREPLWALKLKKATHSLCLFREISYLSPTGQVEGLGRSWVPLTIKGLKMLLITFNPISPKPLGVAVESTLRDDFQIEIVAITSADWVLNPYRLLVEPISSYKRVVRQISTDSIIAYTEEDIVDSTRKQ